MNLIGIILQEEHAQPGLFDLNLGVSFWTIVIFLLLLWALAKYAFPAILGYAQAREDRIRELMESAQRDRDEALRLLEEQKRQLAGTRDEAALILAEAKQAAESVRQEVVEKAHAEHREMLERARGEIEREREKAVDAIRATAVELALAATSKLLGQKVQGDADRRFVQDVIARTGTGSGAA
ncbi:MAG TPA: F0F1 ATP synthase subunit B [Longimicrobiales bacterium]|nr:F0F1 ATP synthase subunit B [Longimicrobiales bacterium]